MITCVRLPHFAASFEIREHPELAGQSFVLVDETSHGPQVSGVSMQAARARVRAGMGLPQAHALCADLLVRPAVYSRYQRAWEDLLTAFTTFSVLVEPEDGLELRADRRRWREVPFLHPSQWDDYPAATCYLDLGKLKPDEIPALAQQLQSFIWEQAHIPARLGLSSGKFPARVAAAAVNTGEVLVVPDGHEAKFLAGFTVALLPVDGETLRQFNLLGWHTLGDVATQPVAALLNRFGKRGRIMHRLANGRDTSPVLPYAPPAVERVTRPLDGPVMEWERLQAVLDSVVTQAAAGLLDDGQTVRQMALVLTLEDGTTLERQAVLRQPSGSLRHIREAVGDITRSLAVHEGVIEVELTLSDILPVVPRQLSLFDRPAVSQDHLNAKLKDLVARYGDGHFYWLRAVNRDARLPERRYRREKVNGP